MFTADGLRFTKRFKRLGTSRLHELHVSKISVYFTYRTYPFETFEFSAHISGVAMCERFVSDSWRTWQSDSPAHFTVGLKDMQHFMACRVK